MSGLFAGTPYERPVTCEVCELPLNACRCPRDAAGKVLLPDQQIALIHLEKRRNGKTVTVIAGLDPHATDLPALLQQLKSLCGAGGTIDVESNTIEVQGDQRAKIAARLRDLGYNVR